MIIDLEKKGWDLYRAKNTVESRKLNAPGYKAIYQGQIKDEEENLKDMNDIDTKSISFSDWKVTFPVKDTALIKFTANATYKGQDVSGTYVSSVVWVNINRQWKAALYHESKAEPQPKK